MNEAGSTVIRRYWLILILAFRVAQAAELKPETVGAWDKYVETMTVSMQERLAPGGTFLWTAQSPVRAARVRQGEIVVAAVPPHNPKRVPFGLIHHWIGAAFFPNTKLQDVFSVVRDYDRYKDFYHPNVVDSKVIAQSGGDDRFSMLLINKFVLVKTALDSDHQTSYFQVDPHRWYSISRATRVQEIDNYGQPSEQELPADRGNGYIWRLFSIARFEERDEGVYVEIEAAALSRDIPVALRWMVEPIVSRVSKSLFVTSLQQTQSAVTGAVARTLPSVSPGSSSPHVAPVVNSFRAR